MLIVLIVSTYSIVNIPSGIDAGFLERLKLLWNDWSRCSDWSSAGESVFWEECDDHCKSIGKVYGQCEVYPCNSKYLKGKNCTFCYCYPRLSRNKNYNITGLILTKNNTLEVRNSSVTFKNN